MSEEVDAKPPRVPDRAERSGGAVEADDHQRRFERERGNRVRRHPGWAVLTEARDHADAGDEAAADVAEGARVNAGAHGGIFSPGRAVGGRRRERMPGAALSPPFLRTLLPMKCGDRAP